MPSAASYTNKIRFAASVKNTKAQLVGGVGNLTQGSIAGCGLDIQYNPIDYVENCPCNKNPPYVAPPPQSYIVTIAGNGVEGYSGDGGSAISAQLNYPFGVAVDSSGNVYIADTNNHRIRKVTPGGVISNFAGNGVAGYSDGGGIPTNAQLNSPDGVAVDSSGNVYIADTDNNRIRKVSALGLISNFAGNGVEGDSTGGGIPTNAQLNSPFGVAVDSSRNVYIADTDNHRIRKVSALGLISNFAGNGVAGYSAGGGIPTDAQLNYPDSVAVDSSGNVYIADSYNHRIRKVDIDGVISNFAGNGVEGYSGDGGSAISAQLNYPFGVAVDSSGNVYIADTNNHRIRKVTPGGVISTILGNGVAGYSDGGGIPTNAQLNSPDGVAVDSSGNLYIADTVNNRIRKLYYA